MQIKDVVANGVGLHAVLNLSRLTEIVDVGANPIDGDPPYKAMLESGICRVTGFEPQKEALERLLQSKSNNETYLPYAVGDGKKHTLRLYNNVGLVSLLELDPATIEIFQHFKPGIGLRGEEEIETQRLDDLREIPILDFLKIDIQGGELAVFRNGKRKLAMLWLFKQKSHSCRSTRISRASATLILSCARRDSFRIVLRCPTALPPLLRSRSITIHGRGSIRCARPISYMSGTSGSPTT